MTNMPIARSEEPEVALAHTSGGERRSNPLTNGRSINKGIASSFPLAALKVAPRNDKVLV